LWLSLGKVFFFCLFFNRLELAYISNQPYCGVEEKGDNFGAFGQLFYSNSEIIGKNGK